MFVWLRMPWEFVRLMTRKSSAAQRNYTNRLTVSYSRLLETQLNQERDRINMRRLTAGLVIFALVVKSPVRGPTRLVLQSRLFLPPKSSASRRAMSVKFLWRNYCSRVA
jgi:hypothetical protein